MLDWVLAFIKSFAYIAALLAIFLAPIYILMGIFRIFFALFALAASNKLNVKARYAFWGGMLYLAAGCVLGGGAILNYTGNLNMDPDAQLWLLFGLYVGGVVLAVFGRMLILLSK